MSKNGLLKKYGIKRNAIKKDIFYFALPGLILWIIEVNFCAGEKLSGLWGTVWGLIKKPQTLPLLPGQSMAGLALFIIGLTIMLIGQVTLWHNYSGTVLIREDHQLITHDIYRYTRNPIYLGFIMVTTGLPVYAASLNGFFTSFLLIPLILNRIRLEEELLTEAFQDAYQEYKERSKKLIPFNY